MRLSDLMAGIDLKVFPVAAIPVLMVAFGAVAVRIMSLSRRTDMRRAALFPLDASPSREGAA